MLLRGHVAEGAHHHLGPGDPGALAALPQAHPEVGHLQLAVGGEQQVGGLEVPVDDPGLVGHLQGAGDGLQPAQEPGRGLAEALLDGAARAAAP